MPVWYMHTVAWRKFQPSPYFMTTYEEKTDGTGGGFSDGGLPQ